MTSITNSVLAGMQFKCVENILMCRQITNVFTKPRIPPTKYHEKKCNNKIFNSLQ